MCVVKTSAAPRPAAVGTLEPVGCEHGPDDARTRDRVARALHEHGPCSAVALGARFGLTPAAVRRHLEALIAGGLVDEVPEPKVRGRVRGRGRPAKLFGLTDAGRAAFPHAYDELATAALDYLRETGGETAVHEFARQRAVALEERYGQVLAGVPTQERPFVLAEALSADGYAASAEHAGAGLQVCQHHCPVAHVAAEFPQLCEAETEAFGQLLGTHVQRLATIAHGDGICTTHVPCGDQAAPSHPTSRKVDE
jgi:predicted ArsR family transcriptional regulator